MNSPTLTRSAPCLARLVLELRHPAGLAEAGEALQHPASWACSGTWLCTNSVQRSGSMPSGEQLRGGDPGALAQQLRVLLDGDRVQVDDAVERLVGRPAAPPTAAARRGSCRGGTSRRWAGCRRAPWTAWLARQRWTRCWTRSTRPDCLRTSCDVAHGLLDGGDRDDLRDLDDDGLRRALGGTGTAAEPGQPDGQADEAQ